MTRFSDHLATALASVRHAAGETVTYTRKSGFAVSVTAVRGQAAEESQNAFNVVQVETRRQAWLVAKDELAESGTPFIPERGERITDSGGMVYEVVGAAGEPEYRYSDPDRTTLRIQTIEVANG